MMFFVYHKVTLIMPHYTSYPYYAFVKLRLYKRLEKVEL
ncbi:hypothetical protein HMPREF9713_03321 [Myroides odoratimimus CCUG 12700]|nr:hypothetical protein HMPREF9713_03321 [Myroides odoratimimus CCUG 12700]